MIEEILNSTVLWAAVGVVLGVPFAGILLSVAARVGVKNVRLALDYWHKVDDFVIEAGDDPNDWIIKMLDRAIPGKADVVLSTAWAAFFRAVGDELDKQAPSGEGVTAK